MRPTLQNLRCLTSGVQPVSLEPGQLCFNLPDRLMFVGDGSSVKTQYDGTSTPGVPGEGWFAVPLSFSGTDGYYVANPSYYGDIPTDGEILAWDAGLDRIVWRAASEKPDTYLVTNAEVASAPGSDVSAKISNAIGTTPASGDSVIVTGVSGDTYQAFYQFIGGFWVYASSYAPPLASEVPITPVPGLAATNTQEAVEEVFNFAEEVLRVAEAAQTTASNALEVANNALPKSGGTMTGNIEFNGGQPVDAGSY